VQSSILAKLKLFLWANKRVMIPLPDSIDPTLKMVINGLVYLHILVFIIYVVLLCRSFGKNDGKELAKFKKGQGKLE